MAIVVEQRRNHGGIVAFLIWLVLLAIIGGGAYYVFFKRPEVVPVPAPAALEEAKEISKIRFNPQEVLENPKFKALRNYITPSEAKTYGKANPFLGGTAK